MANNKTLVLAILDGWGYNQNPLGNALQQAQTSNIDYIQKNYPTTLLQASGLAVGLEWGEVGNSEVGHLNMGAGRIVQQYMPRINKTIKDKSFFQNKILTEAFENAKQNSSAVHCAGLLTSGTVHSSFGHLVALLEFASQFSEVPFFLHLFSDGKDSGLKESGNLLKKLVTEIKRIGCGKIATIIGREYAMDRDNNWDLTQRAYELLMNGSGKSTSDIYSTIEEYYKDNKNDQNMVPILLSESGFNGMNNADSLIFFNFREDAIRQLARCFVDSEFKMFPLKKINLYVVAMSQYFDDIAMPVIFLRPEIHNTFAEVISNSGLRQLHITETEKYAHVTYFFNGLRVDPYPGEDDVLIESYREHEQHPEMRSNEISDKIIQELEAGTYDCIIANYPNADIISHTGNFEATVLSIQAIDLAIKRLYDVIVKNGHTLVLTADHGNAESLTYSTGERETRHNENPVPFSIISPPYRSLLGVNKYEVSGILADIAPTILELMQVNQPLEMSGGSLLANMISFDGSSK